MCLDDRRIELFVTSVTLFRSCPFVHNVVSRNNEWKQAVLSPVRGVQLSVPVWQQLYLKVPLWCGAGSFESAVNILLEKWSFISVYASTPKAFQAWIVACLLWKNLSHFVLGLRNLTVSIDWPCGALFHNSSKTKNALTAIKAPIDYMISDQSVKATIYYSPCMGL